MTDDLRNRLVAALEGLVVLGDSGSGRLLMSGGVEQIADALAAAIGQPEVQWSTTRGDITWITGEVTAKQRARLGGHTLNCRRVLVIEGWHEPKDPDADQVPANEPLTRKN